MSRYDWEQGAVVMPAAQWGEFCHRMVNAYRASVCQSPPACPMDGRMGGALFRPGRRAAR